MPQSADDKRPSEEAGVQEEARQCNTPQNQIRLHQMQQQQHPQTPSQHPSLMHPSQQCTLLCQENMASLQVKLREETQRANAAEMRAALVQHLVHSPQPRL